MTGSFGFRGFVRVLRDQFYFLQKREFKGQIKRVLVVGAGDAGYMISKEIRKNHQCGYEIVGFLDDMFSKFDE